MDFKADICLFAPRTYTLSGSATASPDAAGGLIRAVASVTITNLATSAVIVTEAASNSNQNVPISMPVPLPAGCFSFEVSVFAETNGAVSAVGIASASCNVTLSP